ncbi:MAG: hypothetical protein Q8Q04_02430 [archaeon]|nr:hypothetical protein [archaeon]
MSKFKEFPDSNALTSLGYEPFSDFEILYTTFFKKENPEDEDKISESFNEIVLSRNKSGVKKYIEEKCAEEFKQYKFEWDKEYEDLHQSNDIEDKNILVIINRSSNKKSLDAIIAPKKDF